jgi:hypothetical protein
LLYVWIVWVLFVAQCAGFAFLTGVHTLNEQITPYSTYPLKKCD